MFIITYNIFKFVFIIILSIWIKISTHGSGVFTGGFPGFKPPPEPKKKINIFIILFVSK